ILRLEAFADARYAHETAQRELRQARHRLRQRGQPVRGHSRFAFLRVDVDLDADVELRRVVWPLAAEPLRDLRTIDRVDPLKILRDGARLVRLEVADEMPGEVVATELPHLGERLLYEVLAE